jgi:hypothetical protein
VRYLGRTLQHLARVIDENDVVHVQGMFALTPELIAVAKSRRATVVCSHHNTFVREDFYFYCASPAEGMPDGHSRSRGVRVAGRRFRGDPCLEFVDRCGGVVLTEPADLRTAVADLLNLRGRGVEHPPTPQSRGP